VTESAPGSMNVAATPYGTPTPTPTPQAPEVSAAQFIGKQSAQAVSSLKLPTGPAARVVVIDGVPTVVSQASNIGEAGIGQLVSDDDLRLFGEEPERFPACEFPGCKGEGRYSIIAGGGKPLSINKRGELEFGTPPPIDEYGMSPQDVTRAKAGLVGVIGPSGAVGRQLPKSHVDVCLAHQSLPHAPGKPKTPRVAGPFKSYPRAGVEAHKVSLRVRSEAGIYSVKRDGVDEFYVRWFE
jgi:hypothetical protein